MAAVRGVNASNYVAAGRAASQNFVNTISAAYDNAPKYDRFGVQQVKDEAKMKKAAMKADYMVADAGIRAEAALRETKINIDRDKSLAKSRGLVRKAGVVSAAGALAADALRPVREPFKPDWSLQQGVIDKQQDRLDNDAKILDDPNLGLTRPTSTVESDLSGINTSQSSGVTPSTTSSNVAPITGSGKNLVSQDAVYQGLVSRGLSPNDAKIGSAVMMGESRGEYWTDTVQSGLDVNKNNEYSIGLMQINTKAHMDKLNRRGWTIDDLRNPDKNLDIAVEVFKEAGDRWTPWGAYTNQKYLDFLK